MEPKYKLSVICPAIRSRNWFAVYKSIQQSFSGSFELILVTEVPLPPELEGRDNIKVIYSERSPMQKQQQALEQVEGEYVTIISDDSLWEAGTLDKSISLIEQQEDYKTVIILKYLEGKEFDFPQWYLDQVPQDMKFKTNYDFMRADKYYWSDTHTSSSMPGIPHHSPILSCALYTRKLLWEVGGWDAIFNSQAMGNVDLSARLMYYGCKYIIQDLIVSTCGYYEQDSEDHGPLHWSQIKEDEPLLHEMYKIERKDRIILSMDNWRLTESIWKWKNKELIEKAKKGTL